MFCGRPTLNQREFHMVKPRAADAFGEVAGIKAQLNRLALDLLRDLFGDLTTALDQILMRVNLVLDETAHRSGDHFLLFIQAVLHRGSFLLAISGCVPELWFCAHGSLASKRGNAAGLI